MGKTIVQKKIKYLIGIDEVGRGPLAGPVTVCAFAISMDQNKIFFKKIFAGATLRDSKGMSAVRRVAIDSLIRNYKKGANLSRISFSIKSKTAKQIDSKGISKCIKELIGLCLQEILKLNNAKVEHCRILLDGGLKAPAEFANQKTYIKGDTLFPVISFASILAKVHRDEFMKKGAGLYPLYQFDIHKGYGTLAHRNLIKKHGLSDFHRKSFCRNLVR